ncbi:hypothetical protein MSP8886_00239 [Marinomonas spartinae]|uniref:Uncharacterized protein n=1 Tax=Marinomonas spartinae TaxID=1792290 RepID=A0A1A8T0E5_9GAMM|nr:hypothetical protein [Marinomonas spartinae]SBS25314.1 hypothetical protein MSP8886_00239 [Marinomonas spartinae]
MWTLLLWLNQKIIKWYKDQKEKRKDKEIYRKEQNIQQSSRHLPDFVKRDMGLPPYNSNRHDLP